MLKYLGRGILEEAQQKRGEIKAGKRIFAQKNNTKETHKADKGH